ncbi:hypothetical protein [Aeromicrobium massiliense]|uniref:hypothetical protein n=1 Tax=Aeromicrobium massiliense TaxID=1464554 RepID=UPI0002D30CD8|nr:hypothetical protein [Aeromicrobium massiliense]
MSSTTYRLARPYALRAFGFHLIAAAVTAFAGVLALGVDTSWVRIAGWALLGVTVLAVLDGVRVLLRPPVVARLDERGIRAGRGGQGELRVLWSDVETVEYANEGGPRRLQLTLTAGGTPYIALSAVGDRADELIREVHARMNSANGYRTLE